MLRRILLPALLVIALFATVGIASAAVERTTDDDSATSTTTAEASTSTTIDDSSDGIADDDSATSTTMAEASTSTTIDDSSDGFADDDSATIDDDDDSDDDSTTSTTIDGAVSIPDGVHVIDASPAGSMTVAVKDGVLSLVSVDIAGDWTGTKTEMSAREIELEFRNDGTELEVKAEIEDGRLRTRAEFKVDHDGSDDD